jgi:hypothetical protein
MIPSSQTHQGLWRLVVPPTIWAVHFMASYATASVWCSKVAVHGSPFWQVQTIIAVYSVIALAGIGFIGWIGYSECARGVAAQSQDTPEGRYRFLGYATLLLSALSGVATAFAALAAFFFRSCA